MIKSSDFLVYICVSCLKQTPFNGVFGMPFLAFCVALCVQISLIDRSSRRLYIYVRHLQPNCRLRTNKRTSQNCGFHDRSLYILSNNTANRRNPYIHNQHLSQLIHDAPEWVNMHMKRIMLTNHIWSTISHTEKWSPSVEVRIMTVSDVHVCASVM